MSFVDVDLTTVAGPIAQLGKGIIGALSRRGLEAVLGDEQERALIDVCERAVRSVVRDAAVIDEPAEGWFDEVAAILAAVLDDPQRIENLVRASLRELSGRAEAAWRAELRTALAAQRDLELLQETVDVDRLLEVFAPTFWDELGVAAAKPDSPLAPLWEHTVLRRILDALEVSHLPELSTAQLRDRSRSTCNRSTPVPSSDLHRSTPRISIPRR